MGEFDEKAHIWGTADLSTSKLASTLLTLIRFLVDKGIIDEQEGIQILEGTR